MTTRQSLLARPITIAAVIGGAAAATALIVGSRAKQAEQKNPPLGHFIEVDGVRLHYVERGQGEPLVLLHGNGSMAQDFLTSGLGKLAAERYRVIAFDRPGFGYSERPRSTVWTPAAQASLIAAALERIGAPRALVLGHSWGASVALALALDHPETVQGLILESGYYYPSVRGDVVFSSGPAIPILGDVLRYTLSPPIARLLWPAMIRKLFSPAPVAASFQVPAEMATRPSQLRASSAEAILMIPDAWAAQDRYQELTMPISIVAGTGDRIVDPEAQSRRLHLHVHHSQLHVVEGCGHMVHHTAPGRVMAAIDETALAA